MPFKEYRTASACHLHGSTTIVKTGTYAGTGLALSRKGPSMASADLSGSCEYSHPLSQSYSGFESIILELFQVGDCLPRGRRGFVMGQPLEARTICVVRFRGNDSVHTQL